jgi:hypothetical protein
MMKAITRIKVQETTHIKTNDTQFNIKQACKSACIGVEPATVRTVVHCLLAWAAAHTAAASRRQASTPPAAASAGQAVAPLHPCAHIGSSNISAWHYAQVHGWLERFMAGQHSPSSGFSRSGSGSFTSLLSQQYQQQQQHSSVKTISAGDHLSDQLSCGSELGQSSTLPAAASGFP